MILNYLYNIWMMNLPYLNAHWLAPSTISALSTTRYPGNSRSPFAENNLALHVEDKVEAVLTNRQALRLNLALPNEPEWLEQTHSNHCVIVEKDSNRKADAAITQSKQHVLVILTADCLPILLCNRQGSEIAAIHAGWRGLVNGIVENTLAQMSSQPSELVAWIGPAICQSCYEVGDEVLHAFETRYSFAKLAFRAQQPHKWRANLPLLAEKILLSSGLFKVSQSKICTFEQSDEFYSYRKQPQTGRIATLIWINSM